MPNEENCERMHIEGFLTIVIALCVVVGILLTIGKISYDLGKKQGAYHATSVYLKAGLFQDISVGQGTGLIIEAYD